MNADLFPRRGERAFVPFLLGGDVVRGTTALGCQRIAQRKPPLVTISVYARRLNIIPSVAKLLRCTSRLILCRFPVNNSYQFSRSIEHYICLISGMIYGLS